MRARSHLPEILFLTVCLSGIITYAGFWLHSQKVSVLGASPTEFGVAFFTVFSALWGAIATILSLLRD